MKNQTIRILALIFLCGSWLTGCATAESPSPDGTETETSVTLPFTSEKVWYRTDKVRPFGMAYEASGSITVGENAVEFTHKNGKVTIPKGSVQKVIQGTLWPDLSNKWVIVYFADAGNVKVAAFKGGPFSGSEKDDQIFSAILNMMTK